MPRSLRTLPLVLLLTAVPGVWIFGRQLVSWQALAGHVASLHAGVAAHPFAGPAAFALVYLVVTALSVPEAALLSVAGGALFGTLVATLCIVLGASAGAVVLFLAARTALAEPLAARAAPLLDRIRPSLERDGFFYLLALRLFPLAPFWLVNLAPALAGMRLTPFATATLIGIVPGSAVFAAIGAGLGDVLAAGGPPDLAAVLQPRATLPLAGLAILALVPVLWRRRRPASRG